MPERKQAVVVGALGVIGRYIVERLLREDDWSVIGLSRRRAEAAPRYRHISVDLLDAETAAAKLAGLTEATHVFYAAFQPAAGAAAGYASNIAPNRDMLVNAVTRDRCGVVGAAPRGAGDRHQILRLASRAVQDAGARERSAPHAARLLFRSDRLAHRLPARQARGTGWSCGRRPCAALRRARR